MSKPSQLYALRMNNQTFVNINSDSLKDVYAMIYGAIDLVSKQTNTSIQDTMSILLDLDNYLKEQQTDIEGE